MKVIAFSTMAIPQPRLSSSILYRFTNDRSVNELTDNQTKVLPSAPATRSQLVPYNCQLWVGNRDARLLVAVRMFATGLILAPLIVPLIAAAIRPYYAFARF